MLLPHEIDIFKENLDLVKKPKKNSTKFYGCNLHFRDKQKILNAPVHQELILVEKSTLRETEVSQKCIMYYDAVMELSENGLI
jgi:hypothetical protein